MIINYMEIVVKDYLEELLKSDPIYENICKCELCIDDIMAKTLNNIKPYYITSKTGEIYAEYSSLENQQHVEIISEITKAIEFISKHPNH